MREAEELIVTFRPRAKRRWQVRRGRERVRLTEEQVTALVRIVAVRRDMFWDDEAGTHVIRFDETGRMVSYTGRSVG